MRDIAAEAAAVLAVFAIIVGFFVWYVTGWMHCNDLGGAWVEKAIGYECVQVQR